jgi:hypothetical protein
MTTLEMPCEALTLPSVSTSRTLTASPLFDLQLRAARRADELARKYFQTGPEHDRRLWLRAELEIFERSEGAVR